MPVGRNDPCPCGSGKKYKKCCGAVVAINPVSATPGARQCGSCTACCDGWVKGTILGHEMKPGQPCHFRGEGCCSIYERRPVDPCRNFVCGWLQQESPFPERSEEHTSELQSPCNLVCRLLLEKKKKHIHTLVALDLLALVSASLRTHMV